MKRIPESTWAEIRTAYASGIGLREIARNMNIPEGTVLARAKRENWTREIQSARALAKREDAEKAISPIQAVAMSIHQRADRHVERMAGVSEKVVSHVESLEPSAILDQIDKVEKRIASRGERSASMTAKRALRGKNGGQIGESEADYLANTWQIDGNFVRFDARLFVT